MIGYLRGELLGWQLPPTNRKHTPVRTLLVHVQGVGYEVVVTNKTALQWGTIGTEVQLFIHTHWREDGLQLYGFMSLPERDMFRQLLSVSGIGTQMGMALLDTLGLPDLVRAIVTGNHRLLCLAQGVGAKTAERICLELKSKLSEWREVTTGQPSGLPSQLQEEVELTLLALGYSAQEIAQALSQVNIPPAEQNNLEAWIKQTIAWLAVHS